MSKVSNVKHVLFIILINGSLVWGQQDSCPFGLKWGMSHDDIIKMGVINEKIDSDNRFTIYEAKSLPKNLSIAESYHLIIDIQYGLQKIIMISKDITDDPYGIKGKEKYNEIKNILISKYGLPKPYCTLETVGAKLYDESDEFYECLAYPGCGYWFTCFKSDTLDLTVGLELKGLRRGTGYIKLTYEGPCWNKSLEMYEKTKSESDTDAM